MRKAKPARSSQASPQKAPAELPPLDLSGVVSLVGALLAFGAFFYYYQHSATLLYGDAVAHINIARRVIDGREPGIRQLGTVWLPFPHLLMIPFLFSDNFWVSGIGGSLPSMAAFVLGAVGLYRQVWARTSHAFGLMAAGIYLLNPNLLYMQATAMGESVFLALMIWAVMYLDAFARGLEDRAAVRLAPEKALARGAIVLACGVLTRYDGWFLALGCGIVGLIVLVKHWAKQQPAEKRALVRAAVDFTLLCALAPAMWLSYNYLLSRHPLDFADGPYSAKAIAERTTPKGAAPYPGKDHPAVAAEYFLKAAKLNMSEGGWQFWLMCAVLAGTAATAFVLRGGWGWLLLWMPLPFYALSIAYGSVPIFIPQWWPFSYYNVRYGLEMLPAFAVSLAALGWLAMRAPVPQKWDAAGPVVILALVAGGYAWCWKSTPICLREAHANGDARMALDRAVGRFIKKMPDDSTILMQTGSYVGALQLADRHLEHVIWEGVFWQWEGALNQPAQDADYVIAFDDDMVSQAAKTHPQGLQSILVLRVNGQPPATIYRSVVRNARPF